MAFQGDDIDQLLAEDSGGVKRETAVVKREGGSSRSRKRRRSRSRTRKHRRRRRSRSRSRRRGHGRSMEEIISKRYKKVADRNKRTVFSGNVHPKVEEFEVFEFFSEAGKVVDIQLIRDPRSSRSKGMCYIEFEDINCVQIALSLSGRQLGGYPIMVQLTQGEKNIAAMIAQDMANSQRSLTLKVKNLAKEMREDDLQPVFAAFGDVSEIYLRRSSDGKTREGYVEFVKSSEGIAAMEQLNGLEILGKKMRVYTDKPVDTIGMIDPSAVIGQITSGISSTVKVDPAGLSLTDETGNNGLIMSSSARTNLMAKLHGGAFANEVSTVVKKEEEQPKQPQVAAAASTSPCLLLSNMFDPAKETDPDFDLDIREDVMDEVAKYGQLRHIYVDKTSVDGQVFLKFVNHAGAAATFQALNHRWFGQSQIKCQYVPLPKYNSQFPDAA